jgi:hypothetical protein
MEWRRKDVQSIVGSTTNSGWTNMPVRLRDHYPEPTRQATWKGLSLSLPMKQDGTRRECNPGAWPPVVPGRLLMTEAKRTTTSRRQEAAKQATTCIDDLALSQSFHTKGTPIGHALHNKNGGTLASLTLLRH